MTEMRPPIASASRLAGEVGCADELEHDVEWAAVGEVVGRDDGDDCPRPRAPSDVARRSASLRTVAVTWAPASTPSCTPAMPTPPAAPCTRRCSPGREPALREEGVVRGREDLGEAAGLGPGTCRRAPGSPCARARARARPAPPPPTTAITRSPTAKCSTFGPTATTSPASSRPGMSAGESGGAA